MNEEVYIFPSIFPTPETETENWVICLTAVGNKKPFHCLMVQQIADLHLTGDSQCFPFLRLRRGWDKPPGEHHRLGASTIPGTLPRRVHRQMGHLPLRLCIPASPRLSGAVSGKPQAGPAASSVCTPDFWAFAEAGGRLGEIHIGYEEVPEHQLTFHRKP